VDLSVDLFRLVAALGKRLLEIYQLYTISIPYQLNLISEMDRLIDELDE